MNNILKKQKKYIGWELSLFDRANVFRDYQFNFLRFNITGSVCEVGPGHGVICDRYIKLSQKISLYEQSKKLFRFLKKKYSLNPKIRVYNKCLKPSKKKYDTILYLDVLEHIKQPKKELKNVFRSLKKQGKLILSLPAYQHLFSQFDKDVGHYRRYTLKKFLSEMGGIKHSGLKYYYIDTIGYFLSLTAKIFLKKNYKSNFDKKIRIWNYLIYISKILDFITMYSFGKTLIIIVQK